MTKKTFYHLLNKYTNEKNIKWGTSFQPLWFSYDGITVNCPLSFVADCLGKESYFLDPFTTGKNIGLKRNDITKILAAVEDTSVGDIKPNPQIRQAILRATNLAGTSSGNQTKP